MTEDELSARWAPTLQYLTHVATHRHTPAEDATVDEDLPFTASNDFWEDAVKVSADPGPQTGVMVAFYPSTAQQQQLAIEGGEPAHEVHLTLAFLGEVGAELVPADEPRLIETIAGWAAGQQPVTAITNGHGIFTSGVTPVTFANVDAPNLPTVRQSLVEALEAAHLPPLKTHGYTPHITLAYDEVRDVQVPDMTFTFDEVVIAFAGQQTRIGLGKPVAEGAASTTAGLGNPTITYDQFVSGDHTFAAHIATTSTPVFVNERPRSTDMSGTPLLIPGIEADTAKAFVTNINGRTLITGPATTIAAMKDPTVEDIAEQHMLWMHGRFVGADTPNRNGALWSAGDLEMAKGTVVNGPLNWLHDAKHVIGTLAQADYVDPSKAAQTSGLKRPAPMEPHITATAAIWKCIYPDEAYVVQQASEQGMLWYSMECISKQVSCVGEAGCGNTTTYAAYMAGAACEHVVQRASVRRFISPVFLGGAVIVPPTRPGWAEADARVMSTATSLAEAAFEQAGRPDVSASDWEQLMSQLVLFTQE